MDDQQRFVSDAPDHGFSDRRERRLDGLFQRLLERGHRDLDGTSRWVQHHE